MNKKILDYPEAAELANDDYIIFDSESGGGCRILAKKIAPVILGIEAIYTQTQEVTPDTPLNDLKQDLVVKAVYRNNRKKAVTDYTLSGTLAVGTSTITVTYSGFTTTFNVEVSSDINYLYNWDFTQSLTDSVQGQVAQIYGSASRTSQGFSNNDDTGYLNLFDAFNLTGKTVEIDYTRIQQTRDIYNRTLLFCYDNYYFGYARTAGKWVARNAGAIQNYSYSTNTGSLENKTMKAVFGNGSLTIYIKDISEEDSDYTVFYDGGTFAPNTSENYRGFELGYTNGGYLFNVTGVRIYDNL